MTDNERTEMVRPRMVEFPLSKFHLRRALYAANRDVLWPLGLALTVVVDEGRYERLYVTEWDFGDGHVEIIEDPEPEYDAEFARFAEERRARMPEADRRLSLAALLGAPAPSEPGLDVETLARALDIIGRVDVEDSASGWLLYAEDILAEYARLRGEQP